MASSDLFFFLTRRGISSSLQQRQSGNVVAHISKNIVGKKVSFFTFAVIFALGANFSAQFSTQAESPDLRCMQAERSKSQQHQGSTFLDPVQTVPHFSLLLSIHSSAHSKICQRTRSTMYPSPLVISLRKKRRDKSFCVRLGKRRRAFAATFASFIHLIYTMELLLELQNVSVNWVKGHDNNTGNEFADMLARLAAEEARNISYSSPFIPVSHKTLKIMVRDKYLTWWQTLWDNHPKCRISRLFLTSVGCKKLRLSSFELQQLSQMVTGHGLFKAHLRHWNEILDISCALCGEADEDSWHLWEYCPVLQKERHELNCYMKNGMSREVAIIRFINTEKMKKLIASNEALIRPS